MAHLKGRRVWRTLLVSLALLQAFSSWSFCGNVVPGRGSGRRFPTVAAQGDKSGSDEEELPPEMMDILKKVQADAQKDYEKPIFDLPGPLRPPAAPARYKALTRIRLRVAPHKFADLVTPTYEIQQGQEFRVVHAEEDEDEKNLLWLRTSKESGGAWFLERGIIGKFAGKKLARRVAGSLEPTKKGPAVMQISEVEEASAEVLPPTTEQSEEKFEGVNQAPPSPYERRKPVLELLEDPEIQAICKEMGIDMERMKKNPEFVEGIARRLYGDEVVS